MAGINYLYLKMNENNYIIRLTDGREIILSPDQIELYPTIKNQTTDLVSGNIVDILYPHPQALYQLLTNPNADLSFDLFLNMIEAADYVRNDDILNKLLVQMANTFDETSFTNATTEIKENMINLVYELPDTVLGRFLQLMKIIKLDYEIALDPSSDWLDSVFDDDLNTSLMVKVTAHPIGIGAVAPQIAIGDVDNPIGIGAVFNKNKVINMFSLDEVGHGMGSAVFSIDNYGNVHVIIIRGKMEYIGGEYIFLESKSDVDNLHSTLTIYNRNNDYESSLSLEDDLVTKISRGMQRHTSISNWKDNKNIHFSIVRSIDNKQLAMFEIPRGKYDRDQSLGEIPDIDDPHISSVGMTMRRVRFIGTWFPSVSPQMEIVMWRTPEDVKNSRYRITAIDLPQKPTFFINNINYLGVPPAIFQNWLIGQGYVLFNSEEDKLLLVRKTVDGHQISLMTDRGDILMEHLFVDEVPIFLVKDMIITVSDQLGDTEWSSDIMPDYAVIDTNTRLKIWYTQNMTKPIPVYDNTFVPEVEDYTPLSIGNVHIGTDDSILLTLVYLEKDNQDINYDTFIKYVYRKYNIKSYQNMPEFFEDKL